MPSRFVSRRTFLAGMGLAAGSALGIEPLARAVGGPKEPADAARIVQLLRDGGYQGFITLEYEMATDPFAAVPEHLRRLRDLIG